MLLPAELGYEEASYEEREMLTVFGKVRTFLKLNYGIATERDRVSMINQLILWHVVGAQNWRAVFVALRFLILA